MGRGGIVGGEQAMSGFVILCRKLDQNLPGRGTVCGLHLREICRMLIVGFIDDGLESRTRSRCTLEKISSDWTHPSDWGGLAVGSGHRTLAGSGSG